jgi:hypothetical protein
MLYSNLSPLSSRYLYCRWVMYGITEISTFPKFEEGYKAININLDKSIYEKGIFYREMYLKR